MEARARWALAILAQPALARYPARRAIAIEPLRRQRGRARSGESPIRLRRALSLLLGLSLLSAACSAQPAAPGGTAPGAAPAPPSGPLPTPVPLAPGETIPTADPALHVFLWGNPATTGRDLAMARDAGFTWVKQRIEWRNVEKNGPGQFEWQEPDRVVQAIGSAGLRLIARVDNQPAWASSRVPFPSSGPPDDLNAWTSYLTALATRYKGRIQAYEIWNEPNLALEWGGQRPDPAAYTALLKASYQAIKAVDPQALVISAGMSPTTEASDKAMPDMQFYRGMYAAGAKGSFDLLGAHAPGYKAEPCMDPAEVAANPDLTNPGDTSSPEAKRVYAFRHVEDVRKLMEEQGDGGRQIAILEMGWTTDQRPNSPYRWHAVSEEQQGRNLVAAFQCARERMAPWLAFMTVIYLPDPSWTAQQEQFWWAIARPEKDGKPGGSPRPAYTALKAALTQKR